MDMKSLVHYRDAADHYASTIGDIRDWVKKEKLSVQKDERGILKITQESMDSFDAEYAETSPKWCERKKASLGKNNNQTHKYVLTDIAFTTISGQVVYRIIATKDFVTITNKTIRKGDLGGWIECYHNLSQDGNSWVDNNATVSGESCVRDNAYVGDDAEISDAVRVTGNATIRENAQISGHAFVGEQALIIGNSIVSEYAVVSGESKVTDQASIFGHAVVTCKSFVGDYAQITDFAVVEGTYVNGFDIIGGVDKITVESNFTTKNIER